MNINNLGKAILSGDYKQGLIIQAFEVNELLDRYIQVHEKRLKSAGTFRSLFRKTNFQDIFEEVENLYQDFEEKRVEIIAMHGDYDEFNHIQQDFYDRLNSYFSALFEAVELLHVLANKQNELSKGLGKDKLSLSENLELEAKYKIKIHDYMSLGGDLNKSFQLLKDTG